MKEDLKDKVLSLKELCEMISISTATGNNWLKLDKMRADHYVKGRPVFTYEHALLIQKELSSDKGTRLKSRRNKNYIKGRLTYRSYLPEGLEEGFLQSLEKELEDFQGNVIYALADACVNIFGSRLGLGDGLNLSDYRTRPKVLGIYSALIEDLLQLQDGHEAIRDNKDREIGEAVLGGNCGFGGWNMSFPYIEGADIPGFLYMSLRNVGSRKAKGAYYTPADVAGKLIEGLDIDNRGMGKVLDPCCGSGNFLIRLPKGYSPDMIRACDIDPVSIALCRINLALRYLPDDLGPLYDNIRQMDYINDPGSADYFDDIKYIIGNPPWGYSYSKKEKDILRDNYSCVKGSTAESYDIFLEASLKRMREGCLLSFVLPEAVLYVNAHEAIREYILSEGRVTALSYLGDIFSKVQCPCVIMTIRKGHETQALKGAAKEDDTAETFEAACGTHVSKKDESYLVCRELDKKSFNLHTRDDEDRILGKMRACPCEYLEGKADFALGIVTGNNAGYVRKDPAPGFERVLRGRDIYRFSISADTSYIKYERGLFQQTAPEEYYRAGEKLLYRFIAKNLVFAYDNNMTLSLNSCNILLPRIEGMSIRYICAVLNSEMAEFYYEKSYRALKVLRSQIEAIPIPIAAPDIQHRLEMMASQLGEADPSLAACIYDEMNQLIAELYGLDEAELGFIRERIDQDPLSLMGKKGLL
ncbi:TaqI-like C-terminal specificity domain-containing protein [Butyrivibrio sp. MC2013]|uniref:TaqI-like C-terminal specificity domain-containing protein n=1 Tax=Butyrivibrio sp. MC2013 TaxID=1280686 RepID=UPI000414C7EB|nr:TaqI-like C-terminal specificity domain-containing protein [Butyrivibrio sp. MC2013]